jgi:UDP-N-acetylmuramyl tripeptide synthase
LAGAVRPASGPRWWNCRGRKGWRLQFRDVEGRKRSIWLGDVPEHCTVSGDNPRTVTVPAGGAGGTTFEVERAGVLLGGVSLRIPGRHYVIDALAALAMGLELGLDFEALADGGSS